MYSLQSGSYERMFVWDDIKINTNSSSEQTNEINFYFKHRKELYTLAKDKDHFTVEDMNALKQLLTAFPAAKS